MSTIPTCLESDHVWNLIVEYCNQCSGLGRKQCSNCDGTGCSNNSCIQGFVRCDRINCLYGMIVTHKKCNRCYLLDKL